MAKAKLSNSPPLNPEQQSQLAERVEIYRQGVQKLHDAYWKEQGFTHNPGSVAIVEDATRFIRIKLAELAWLDRDDHTKGHIQTAREQIHTFIDKTTGDILKPATYKAPAKHPRGNLFDDHNGLKYVNHYGPNYLR